MCSSWPKVGLSENEGEKMTNYLAKTQNMSTLTHCSKKTLLFTGFELWRGESAHKIL